jgi:hypothetical protein
MRGNDERQMGVFSYVSPEQRVPQDHPSRFVQWLYGLIAIRKSRPSESSQGFVLAVG